MPKLLQINTTAGRGSTGHIAETIAALASAKGWDCYLAHGARYVGNTEMTTYQVTSRVGECLHYLKSLLFDSHGLGSRMATKRLVSWIKELSPDVIQIHSIHGYWLNYEVLFGYLRVSGIPVVWTFHDCWPITGHCAIFPSQYCDKWKTGCGNCTALNQYPRSLFVDRSRRNHSKKQALFSSIPNMTVVTVSYWLKGIISQSFLKEAPLQVVHNGVDISVFYPRDNAVPEIKARLGLEGKVVVLSVADQWNEGIGLSDIPRLRALLDNRFIIVLVGLTKSQIEALPDGVVGVLHTNNREELAEIYSAADITFMPQTVATFGLVSVESMACGTPAVVYAPAAAEVIGGNGFVVPARDLTQLAEALSRFADAGGKAKYRESCIQRVREIYDEKINYSRYINLYDSLIH